MRPMTAKTPNKKRGDLSRTKEKADRHFCLRQLRRSKTARRSQTPLVRQLHARHANRNAAGERQETTSAVNRAELALLLNELGNKAGPTALVRRAEAGADVAVKIFVKQISMPVRRSLGGDGSIW